MVNSNFPHVYFSIYICTNWVKSPSLFYSVLWRPSAFASTPPRNSPLHFSMCLQIPGQMKPFLWGATQGHSSSGGHNTPFQSCLALKFHRWWEERKIFDPPSSLQTQPSEEERYWPGIWTLLGEERSNVLSFVLVTNLSTTTEYSVLKWFH